VLRVCNLVHGASLVGVLLPERCGREGIEATRVAPLAPDQTERCDVAGYRALHGVDWFLHRHRLVSRLIVGGPR